MRCWACSYENQANAKFCSACGVSLTNTVPPSTDELPIGTQLLGGAYTIGEKLGQGGFGITYLGHDASLARAVAIKEFFLDDGCRRQGTTVVLGGNLTATSYAQSKQKFLQEGQTLTRFNHPGIVRVFHAFGENNTAYIVMEYLRGNNLGDLLPKRGGQMGESEAVGYIQQVGEALEEVHRDNILHRDIKPDNIMVTNEDRVVLIDFGISRAFAAGKTKQMTRFYTEGYAPLEQYGLQGKFGAFTDIYALGATLYHLLTGKVPVSATDRIQGVELQPVRDFNPTISTTVAQAIIQAMAIKAEERPQSVQAFLKMLKGKTPTHNIKPKPPQTPQPPKTPEPTPNIESTKEPEPTIGGALLGLAADLAGAWIKNRLEKGNQPQPRNQPQQGNRLEPRQTMNSSISLAGRWQAYDGISYIFEQRGNQVMTQGVNPYGVTVVQGQGVLNGNRLDLSYQHIDGSWGISQLQISANGRQMTGMANNQVTGQAFSISLYR